MTVRVLFVCGSLHDRSANQAVLEVAREHLARLDDVETADADEVESIPAFNPDKEDPAPAAVAGFRARMAEADGVLIASPEYAAGLPGALKNALDWIVGSGELYAKPVAVVSAGTTGGHYARRHLIRSLTWQGAHVVAQLGIAGPRTKSDATGRIVDGATIEEIGEVAQTLVDVLDMGDDDRLELVGRITAAAGIEPGHIAPVPDTSS